MNEEKIVQAENIEDKNFDFCITNPKWQKIFFIVFTIIGISFDVGMCILFLCVPTEVGNFLASLSVGAIFIILGVFGLYVCKKEKFVFKDGLFTYVKVFGKAQSARVEDISCVALLSSGFMKIVFYGHDKKVLISFMDTGTAIKSGELSRALDAYAIPFLLR